MARRTEFDQAVAVLRSPGFARRYLSLIRAFGCHPSRTGTRLHDYGYASVIKTRQGCRYATASRHVLRCAAHIAGS